MSIEQKLCTVKIFQLQSMLNVIRCIDQRLVLKNSCVSCLALTFKLKNLSTTVLYAKKSVAGGEIWRDMIWTNGLVVTIGCRESGNMGSIPDDCWNPLLCLGSFVGTEPVSALTHLLFILLFSLDFVCGNLVLTELLILTQTSDLHCFGELEVLNLGPGQHSPTCAGLAYGQRS